MSHLRRLLFWLRGETAYWICEWLCGYVSRRTSCEILNSASAIAAVEAVKLREVLKLPEKDWPDMLRGAMPPFTEAEWKEVLGFADWDRQRMESVLERPEWSHLRRTPDP